MVKITNTRIKKQRKDFQKPTESELSHDDNTEDVFCSKLYQKKISISK